MRRLREYVHHFWHCYEAAAEKYIFQSYLMCIYIYIYIFSQNKDDGKKNDERAGVKKKGQ